MGLFDTIKEMWTEYRTPTQIPIPTAQPTVTPGVVGGVQVIQVPPSLKRAPKPIHATTPTVHIHEREPAVKKDVRIVRDPRTIAETRQALVTMERAVAEKIPTFKEVVGVSVGLAERAPRVTEALVGMREAMTVSPRRELATEMISRFGESVYTEVQEKPLQTAAWVGVGYAATPAIAAVAPAMRFVPYGAKAVRVATRVGEIPYVGYAVRKLPEALMTGTFGAMEYKRVTEPVFADTYDVEGMPIMREPTYPEMASRLGETAVLGAAPLTGAGLYRYGRVGVIRAMMPEGPIGPRVPGMISEVRPSLRAMMAEEKAIAALIPGKVRLARHKEFEKYISWEKEAGKIHKERVSELREELAFKRKYYKELKHKIRTEEKLKTVRELKPLETAREIAAKRAVKIKKQIETGELREVVQPGEYKTLVTGKRVYVPGTVQLLKIAPKMRVPKVKEKPLIEVEIFKPVKLAVTKVEPPRVKVPTVKEIVVPKVKVREKVKIGVIASTLAKEVVGVSVFPLVKPKVKVKERVVPPMYVPVEVTPTVIKERELVAVPPFYTPAVITPTAIKTVTPLVIETVTPVVEKPVTLTEQIYKQIPRPVIPVIPLLKLEKKKKEQLAKKRRARKGFEYYIENPIASIFGNSVGKAK